MHLNGERVSRSPLVFCLFSAAFFSKPPNEEDSEGNGKEAHAEGDSHPLHTDIPLVCKSQQVHDPDEGHYGDRSKGECDIASVSP